MLVKSSKLYPPAVQGPREPLPLWRFFGAFVRNPLRSLPQVAFEEDAVWFSPRKGMLVVWVSSPALIEQVLLADADEMRKSGAEKRVFGSSLAGSVLIADGQDWRWQRKALAPLFRPVDLQTHVPTMAAAGQAQVDRWRKDSAGTVQAIDKDMLRATYEIIMSTMLAGVRGDEGDLILAASEAYLARASWELAYALMRIPPWVPHPATWQMRRAARTLRGIAADLIARRRAGAESTKDLLGRLLTARHPDTNEPMADDLVVSNLLTLIEAGHETTAKALTWTLYLLARSPEWQARVYDEVRAVADDGPVGAGHLVRLVVTQRVIKEAMRLYPPAPIMARDPRVAITLDGRTVPAGSQILVPIYAVHRHRKLWHDPDLFDPDRFLPEAEAARPRAQYMPFGGGPRVCIGQAFAMMEATVLLATFVRAARFDWDGKHLPEPISRVTLRPAGGMPLRVSMR
ncbi:MAG: cytochrome P450 [Hyphomicrobiaceae bacterium]